MAFDYQGFRRAFCEKDVEAWLAFFTEDAKWIEYRHTKPPRDPNVMRGRDEIEAHLRLVADGPLEFELSDEVLGDERAAFRVMCTLPGGRRIIEHVIVELEDGLIARQVDVEAWD
jgi:ketosteroid isomerase-like protein